MTLEQLRQAERAAEHDRWLKANSDKEPQSSGSDQRLVRLLARFRGFVTARRETAENWRARGENRVASMSDTAADHFERCANELERAINGETPADPGHDWPICETNSQAHPPEGSV